MKFDLCGRLLVVAEATTSPRLWRVAASLSSEGEAQLEPSCDCPEGVFAAGPVVRLLKIQAPFWSGLFFYAERTLGPAGITHAFQQ